jgi:hypothetical protein
MTIEITTKINCDCCEKEIKDKRDIKFTFSSVIADILLEAHFCTWQCMKKYVNENFPKEN